MLKIRKNSSLGALPLVQHVNVLSCEESNLLITELKKEDLSTLKSLASRLKAYKGSLNICKVQNEELYRVSDENYQDARVLLSCIAKLVNCKVDLDFADVRLIIKNLNKIDETKFDTKVSDVTYDIVTQDYYYCAGVSDYLMRTGRFQDQVDNFKITAAYSAYECLKPQRVGGVLMTDTLMEELKTKYDKNLMFNASTEIPFLDKIDDKYVALKRVFSGEATGKESLTCEIIEVVNKIKEGKTYLINELPTGSITLLDLKGDLDVE